MRHTDSLEYLFYINHSAQAVTVALTGTGGDGTGSAGTALTGLSLGGSTLAADSLTLPATGVAVLRRALKDL